VRRLIAIIAMACTSLLSACGHPVDFDELPTYDPSEYRLAAGDQVRVIVFGQDAISTQYRVDPSGKLSIPLVGSVNASGKNTAQLEQTIAYILRQKDLVKSPEVSVEVQAFRPFFMLGEVANSGQYPYVPGMSVQEAIATAGGYTIYADKGPVRVTRVVGGEKRVGRLSPLESVAPGDTIYVEERVF